MEIEFYDVKKRRKIKVDQRYVIKSSKEVRGEMRYMLRCRLPDGRTLTKFVSKETWDKLHLPQG
jgi:hypothetical protein